MRSVARELGWPARRYAAVLLTASVVASLGLLGLGAGAASAATVGTLSVIAGTGNWGAPTPGPATSSDLNAPYGVAVDSAGNVYIADVDNDEVEEVSATSGDLSVIAGGGSTIPSPGPSIPATSAQLSYPYGVAVDSAGNVYIADASNDEVEEVSASSGDLSVIAGGGSTIPSPGPSIPATSAQLGYPEGVAVDGAGNVYIADGPNDEIDEVSASSGDLSVIAGGGSTTPSPGPSIPATSAQLAYPGGVAVDSAGNVYISDTYNNEIEEVSASSGDLSVIAGGGSTTPSPGPSIPATSTELAYPFGVAVDSAGNVYIADAENEEIEVVSATSGDLSVIAGTGDAGPSTPGPATSSDLDRPSGVAVDSSGNVYIADTYNSQIEVVSSPSLPTVTGISPAMGLDGGGTTVVIAGTNLSSTTSVSFGTSAATSFSVNSARSVVAVSPAGSGTVHVTVTTSAGTSSPSVADQFSYIGTLAVIAGTGDWGPPTPGPATSSDLAFPSGVAVDSAGNVYFAEFGGSEVEEVSVTTGDLSVIAGGGSTIPSPGPPIKATTAQLNDPEGVAVDSAGNVYIADSNNDEIEEVSVTTGDLSVIAGGGSTIPSSGPPIKATTAQLGHPSGVAVDSAGNVYIADSNNDEIEEISASSGDLSVIAGGGSTTPSPGPSIPATSTELAYPFGVAVDSAGNVYIADTFNSEIEEVSATTGDLSVVAGTGDAGLSTAGPATSSDLNAPFGVAVDSAGNVYIADTYNNEVEEVSATTGDLSVVAGTGGYVLNSPYGVAVDSAGNIYIADSNNNEIDEVSLSSSPTVTAISPDHGPVLGGEKVTVTGVDLSLPMAVDFGSVPATSFDCPSSTTCIAKSPAGSGTVDVTVTTPYGTSTTSPADQFTYGPVPSVSTVSPTSGPVGDPSGPTVTVTGKGFVLGVTALSFDASSVALDCASSTECSFTAPTATSAGSVSWYLYNYGATTRTETFAYKGPSITSATPSSGPVGDPSDPTITVTGKNFVPTMTELSWGGTADPTLAGFSCASSTECSFTAPTATSAGSVSWYLYNYGATTRTETFAYKGPSITSATPSSGPVGDPSDPTITVTGKNFVPTMTELSWGGTADPTLAGFSCASSTECSFTAPTATSAGSVSWYLYNYGATTRTETFAYKGPSITSATPSSGPVGDPSDPTITVTGKNFVPTMTELSWGGTADPTLAGFSCASSTECSFTAPTATSAGSVSWYLYNYGATTRTETFAYKGPSITSATPSSGPVGDPSDPTITVTGKNFVPTMTELSWGGTADPTLAGFSCASSTECSFTAPTATSAGSVSWYLYNYGATTRTETFAYKGPRA